MRTAFISNIKFDATEEELKDLLDEYGPSHVRLVTDRVTGKSKGFAFAEFKDTDGFNRCLQELDACHFMGRALTVKEAEPRKNNGPRDHRPDRY